MYPPPARNQPEEMAGVHDVFKAGLEKRCESALVIGIVITGKPVAAICEHSVRIKEPPKPSWI